MRSGHIKNRVCLIIAGFLFFAAFIFPGKEAIAAGETDHNLKKQAVIQEIKKQIDAAIAQAEREGKTSVDVHLSEIEGLAGPGDLVKVAFKATLGTEEPMPAKTGECNTLYVIAGKPEKVPGLAEAVVGMIEGEKKQTSVEFEKAGDSTGEDNTMVFPAVRKIPLTFKMPPEAYRKKFNLPLSAKGDVIRINPYFESEIIEATEEYILIKNLAVDGYKEHAPFGTTTFKVENGEIIMALAAKKGEYFQVGKRTGVISSSDEKSFTVDFIHGFVGKKILLDIEVLSVVKASSFKDIKISWIEDHDAGFQYALEQKKSKVLVLYASWCRWCEKLFAETMADPRIKMLKDDFVWVKANSDEDQSLKSLYKQDGFPMIVLTDYQGSILKKIEGFKDAQSLSQELELIKNKQIAEAVN